MALRKTTTAIPEYLIKLSRDLSESFRQEQEEFERQQKEKEEKEKKILEHRRKHGLKFAKTIFDWAKELRKDESIKKLIEIGHSYTNGIFFFDGKVNGCTWVGLGIYEDGLWWIKSGCGCVEQYMATPEELAEQVDVQILKEACNWIWDERVWQCINGRFEDMRKSSSFKFRAQRTVLLKKRRE